MPCHSEVPRDSSMRSKILSIFSWESCAGRRRPEPMRAATRATAAGADTRVMGGLLNCLGERADPIIIDVAGERYVLNESRFDTHEHLGDRRLRLHRIKLRPAGAPG